MGCADCSQNTSITLGFSAIINNVCIARFAYAIARGEADDVPCVNKYEDNDKVVYDRGGILDVVVPSSSECVVSVNTCVKCGLKKRNSNSGRRETLASIGLHVAFAVKRLGDAKEQYAHWFLNNSRGGSRGCKDKARSGLRDAINVPIVFANVGIESSETSWYALKKANSE
jgi:hypothetical protein